MSNLGLFQNSISVLVIYFPRHKFDSKLTSDLFSSPYLTFFLTCDHLNIKTIINQFFYGFSNLFLLELGNYLVLTEASIHRQMRFFLIIWLTLDFYWEINQKFVFEYFLNFRSMQTIQLAYELISGANHIFFF